MKRYLGSLRFPLVAFAARLFFSPVASAEIMMTDSTASDVSVLSFASLQEPAAQTARTSMAVAPPMITAKPELSRITALPVMSSIGLGIPSLDGLDGTAGLYDPDTRIKQFAMRSKDATSNFIWLK